MQNESERMLNGYHDPIGESLRFEESPRLACLTSQRNRDNQLITTIEPPILPSEQLWAISYASSDISMNEMIELIGLHPSPEKILGYQRQLFHVSHALLRYERPRYNKLYLDYNTQQKWKSNLSEQERLPNTRFTFKTEEVPLNINALLAYAVLRDFNLESLKQYAANVGHSLDVKALKMGFNYLISKKTIHSLIEAGLIDTTNLEEDFYQPITYWLTDIVLSETFNSPLRDREKGRENNLDPFLPYNAEIADLPPANFLPLLADAFVGLLEALPEYIPAGRFISPQQMHQKLVEMGKMMQKILDAEGIAPTSSIYQRIYKCLSCCQRHHFLIRTSSSSPMGQA